MGNEIRADYTQQFLLPPSLEDWIAADHPVRFIRDFVDSLNLAGLGFRIPEAYEGRPPYVVECLPSELICYPLPRKDPRIAFITCLYPAEPDFDYKTPVLKRLLDHLQREGFFEVQIVAGMQTPFPNGPVSFLRQNGFNVLGEIDRVILAERQESLVLMSRKL